MVWRLIHAFYDPKFSFRAVQRSLSSTPRRVDPLSRRGCGGKGPAPVDHGLGRNDAAPAALEVLTSFESTDVSAAQGIPQRRWLTMVHHGRKSLAEQIKESEQVCSTPSPATWPARKEAFPCARRGCSNCTACSSRKTATSDGGRRTPAAVGDTASWCGCAIPGGRLSADQALGLLELSDRFGRGALRITARQGLEFHDVAKERLRELLPGIARLGLTTIERGRRRRLQRDVLPRAEATRCMPSGVAGPLSSAVAIADA